MQLRPLTAADLDAAEAVDRATLGAGAPAGRVRDGRGRLAHLLRTDPGGAWLALERGEAVGVALALRRERLWGLSVLAVLPEVQGRGVGGRLLEAARGYREEGDAGLILASADPRAHSAYLRLGFAQSSALEARGVVRRERLAAPSTVRRGTGSDLAATAALSRAVRGADHLADLPLWLQLGRTLLVHEHGFAVHAGGSPVVLAAREEDSASELLTACLLASPPGSEVEVHHITEANEWALRTVRTAGLELTPGGPVFQRDLSAPLAPYLPSGSFL